VADISDLKVQVTLTMGEMRNLVALLNLAAMNLPESEHPVLIDEVSGMYFELLENIKEGIFDGFEAG
jgi:hypothetical protein